VFQKNIFFEIVTGLAVLIGGLLWFFISHTLNRISTIENKYKMELEYLHKQIDTKVGDLSEQYKKRTNDIESIKEELQ